MKRAAVIPNSRKNLRVAAIAGSAVIGMLGLAYASVPLYSMFCAATGFGGTTMVAKAYPETVLDRTVTIKFNADTGRNMPWIFKPDLLETEVKLGGTDRNVGEAVEAVRVGAEVVPSAVHVDQPRRGSC